MSLAPDGTQSSIHPLQQGCVNPEGLLPALGDDGTCRPCGYVCEWLPRPKDRTAAAQRGPSEMFGTNSTVPRVTQDWLVSISFKMPTLPSRAAVRRTVHGLVIYILVSFLEPRLPTLGDLCLLHSPDRSVLYERSQGRLCNRDQ